LICIGPDFGLCNSYAISCYPVVEAIIAKERGELKEQEWFVVNMNCNQSEFWKNLTEGKKASEF
jgi:hypothetical protein